MFSGFPMCLLEASYPLQDLAVPLAPTPDVREASEQTCDVSALRIASEHCTHLLDSKETLVPPLHQSTGRSLCSALWPSTRASWAGLCCLAVCPHHRRHTPDTFPATHVPILYCSPLHRGHLWTASLKQPNTHLKSQASVSNT